MAPSVCGCQVLGDVIIHAPQEHWSTTKQDLRFAFRQIRRSPGFSGVVIVTLALGIGGTTAVFSVLQAVLIAPLPYEQPGQLVRFYQEEPGKPATRHYLTAAHFIASRPSGLFRKCDGDHELPRNRPRTSSAMGAPQRAACPAGFERLFPDPPIAALARPGLRSPRRNRNPPRLRGRRSPRGAEHRLWRSEFRRRSLGRRHHASLER